MFKNWSVKPITNNIDNSANANVLFLSLKLADIEENKSLIHKAKIADKGISTNDKCNSANSSRKNGIKVTAKYTGSTVLNLNEIIVIMATKTNKNSPYLIST